MSHWYDSEGNPNHFAGKDGKPTTLREARKLGLYPSVTTVGQVVAKFALTNWLQEQAVLQSLYTPRARFDDIPKLAWAKRVVADAKEKTMAKADAGTDIHDVLEEFQQIGHAVLDFMGVSDEYHDMCDAVMELIEEKTGLDFFDDFKSETRFCDTENGYAGMCDLHGEGWVIDYKSKDSVDDKTRGWPEQAEQLAAYAHGLGIPNARLANVFISRSDPTQVVWYEHRDPMAWERFRHALMLWQVTKKYGPYYEGLKEQE